MSRLAKDVSRDGKRRHHSFRLKFAQGEGFLTNTAEGEEREDEVGPPFIQVEHHIRCATGDGKVE
jgi:hypothetical protein